MRLCFFSVLLWIVVCCVLLRLVSLSSVGVMLMCDVSVLYCMLFGYVGWWIMSGM